MRERGEPAEMAREMAGWAVMWVWCHVFHMAGTPGRKTWGWRVRPGRRNMGMGPAVISRGMPPRRRGRARQPKP